VGAMILAHRIWPWLLLALLAIAVVTAVVRFAPRAPKPPRCLSTIPPCTEEQVEIQR
jgi:hypothetical protein